MCVFLCVTSFPSTNNQTQSTGDFITKYFNKGNKKIYTEEGLNVIAYSAQGDLRKAINSLQICVNYGGEVTEKKAVKICDLPNPKKIKAILITEKRALLGCCSISKNRERLARVRGRA